MMKLHEVVDIVNGTPINNIDLSQSFKGVCIDSRKTKRGELFIALKGEKYDAHDFLNEAFEKGAIAAVVSKNVKFPAIIVKNTYSAMHSIAKRYRELFSPFLIAITGSVGKTTTKEIMASFLSLEAETLRTKGNYNNLIGVPLSLLQLRKKHKYAVVEFGTNQPGEILKLCEIAEPDIGIVLNSANAHLEGFKNRAGVAKEKMTLLSYLKKGIAIYNIDDPFLKKYAKGIKVETITYGLNKKAIVRADNVELSPIMTRFTVNGIPVKTNLTGMHNVYNILAVISAAYSLGIDVEDKVWLFEYLRLPKMRMEKHKIKGITVFNDAYNANPASFKAAIDTIHLMKGRKIVVMGAMKELGRLSKKLHREVAEYALKKVDLVICVGEDAKNYILDGNKRIFYFNTKEEAAEYLSRIKKKDDVILVKGSRATCMEEFIEKLKEVL